MIKKYLLFLAVILLVISGCSQKTTTPPTGISVNTVTIKNFSFQPAELTVNTGDTVT